MCSAFIGSHDEGLFGLSTLDHELLSGGIHSDSYTVTLNAHATTEIINTALTVMETSSSLLLLRHVLYRGP